MREHLFRLVQQHEVIGLVGWNLSKAVEADPIAPLNDCLLGRPFRIIKIAMQSQLVAHLLQKGSAVTYQKERSVVSSHQRFQKLRFPAALRTLDKICPVMNPQALNVARAE